LQESDDDCKTKYEAQRGRGGNCLKLYLKEKFGTLEISFEALAINLLTKLDLDLALTLEFIMIIFCKRKFISQVSKVQ